MGIPQLSLPPSCDYLLIFHVGAQRGGQVAAPEREEAAEEKAPRSGEGAQAAPRWARPPRSHACWAAASARFRRGEEGGLGGRSFFSQSELRRETIRRSSLAEWTARASAYLVIFSFLLLWV